MGMSHHFPAPDATRINVGCGVHPLRDWCNIDNAMEALADLYITVPPIPYPDESLDEIYAGHFLEHLDREEAAAFMAECMRCLKHGGRLGIVVPDMREVFRRYYDTEANARVEYPIGVWRDLHDMDSLYDLMIMSTAQDSPHKWGYDAHTLSRLFMHHGFRIEGDINRWTDPRIPVGAWYQIGLDGIKE